jgi:hypothetical protein
VFAPPLNWISAAFPWRPDTAIKTEQTFTILHFRIREEITDLRDLEIGSEFIPVFSPELPGPSVGTNTDTPKAAVLLKLNAATFGL